MISKRFITICLFLPQLVLAGVLVYGLVNSVLQSVGWIPAVHLTTITGQYYQEVFSNPSFIQGLWFTLKVGFLSAGLSLLIALLICYWMLNKASQSERLLHLFQLPIVVPHLIVALFVLLLFTKAGLIARLLMAMGGQKLSDGMSQWVFHENAIGITLAYLWKEVPFIVFFCYPLMKEYTERFTPVALTLGATRWQTFWQVTLPNCWHTLASSFCIIFAYAVGAYELPKLLGPTVPQTLPELAYVAYTYPDLRHRPYAMVMNVVMALIGIICVVGYLLSMSREEDHG
ncbi:MAG: ABC transporter permease subunit [Aerococcus sp.]|nr:ABC transporter permease subunit [Aerococcus sp.]